MRNLIATCLLLLTLALPGALVAQSRDPNFMLSDMDAAIGQLREIDARGQDIKDRRLNIRRQMDPLASQGNDLMRQKEQLDNRVAQYQSMASQFNAQCTGVSQDEARANDCPSRQSDLNDMAAELDEDAADMSPDVDEYNQEMDAYKAQDAEMAREEQALYEQSLVYVDRIESVKSEFAAFATASRDPNLVTDVTKCNSLKGYEDTLFCLRRVWELIQ